MKESIVLDGRSELSLLDIHPPQTVEGFEVASKFLQAKRSNEDLVVGDANPTKKLNGKPVLYRKAKTVLNMESPFAHKLLCTGPVLNLGDACGFSCSYCYVEDTMRKLIHQELGEYSHQDVVMRRRDALKLLQNQLVKNKQKQVPHVVYSSSLVDIAANMELMKETAAACTMILDQTAWEIRLLTKSNLLPKLVALIPEKYKHRLILGVSTGTFDDELGKEIEKGTAPVSMRIESLHRLQDNGYRTFGMVCPSLPQDDDDAFARQAADLLRYDRCEQVWAEVINLRGESFTQTIAALDSAGLIGERDKLALVCGPNAKKAWEEYSRATFEAHAKVVGPEKLRFLQYVDRKENLRYWKDQEVRGAVILGRQRNKTVEPAPAPLPVVEGIARVRHLVTCNKLLEVKFRRRALVTMGQWTENTITAGEFFSRQKEKLPHGQYLNWIVSNFPIDRKTANNYVAVYERRDVIREEIKRGNVPHLKAAYDLARKANRLLKAPEHTETELGEQDEEEQLEVKEDAPKDAGAQVDPTEAPAEVRDPILVLCGPELVLAACLEAAQTVGVEFQHQIIREDGLIKLNDYFNNRLGLKTA